MSSVEGMWNKWFLPLWFSFKDWTSWQAASLSSAYVEKQSRVKLCIIKQYSNWHTNCHIIRLEIIASIQAENKLSFHTWSKFNIHEGCECYMPFFMEPYLTPPTPPVWFPSNDSVNYFTFYFAKVVRNLTDCHHCPTQTLITTIVLINLILS